MNVSRSLAILLATALVACSPTPAPPGDAAPASTAPADVAAATASAPAAAPAASEHGALWFEPAALSACGGGKYVVNVNWDASATPEVTAIQIVAIGPDGIEGNFAASGPAGSKESGPWMHAGSTMILRNAADGKDIARATMGSTPCP